MSEERWMTSREAAEYLGYSDYTMKRARVDGNLAGRTQPKYTKWGKSVRYLKKDLEAWAARGKVEV